jgi:hypothetical protein
MLAPEVQADHRDSGERHDHARDLRSPRPLAQHDRREQHREQGLRLQHQRRQAGRHAQVHADEQQAELADAEGQPDEREPQPRDRGPAYEQHGREGRGHEPQTGEQERRHRVEADLDDDEVDAPDGGDQDRDGDVARSHMADAGRVKPLRTSESSLRPMCSLATCSIWIGFAR